MNHKCSVCGEIDLSKFYKKKSSRTGLQLYCIKCTNDYQREYKRLTRKLIVKLPYQKKITIEDRTLIRTLHAEGISVNALAVKFDVTEQTIRHHLK